MAAYRHALRVAFDDVDHAGIVYYPRFFHYFHLAFEHWVHERFAAGGGYRGMLDLRRIGFPAVHAEADYKQPLRFGDRVTVTMVVERLGGKSASLAYGVEAEGGALHAAGRVVVVVTDLDSFRAVAMPEDVRAEFESLRAPG
jgi:4-hydroxybenzoyl-CoA thioesterase